MKRDLIFLLIISALTVAIWFSSGKVLAAGEESFSIFNESSMETQASLWQTSGTGYPFPVYVTRFIPAMFVKFFLTLNIQMFLIQAVFYFLLICSGMIGIYFLAREFLKTESIAPLIVALFYFLNLYSQTQVFARFLYSGMAAWSFLPISLLLWIKWGKTNNLIWIFLFCFFSVVFSIAYLQPANMITLWAPLVLWTGWLTFKNRRNKFLIFRILLFSVLGMAFWVLANIWWLYPYYKVGGGAFSEISDWFQNFESLRGVSQYFSTGQIILLRQSFLLGKDSPWYIFYSQFWVNLISVGVFLIAVYGCLRSRKEKYWLFLTGLALCGWFISKGSNPPLGYEFFKFLFSSFSITAILRNPYEKFGLVWLLPYSIFFGMGGYWLSEKFRGTIKNLLSFVAIVAICGILVLPMWTGDVFPPYTKVALPDYYLEANRFLNSIKGDGRMLMLPLIPGDSVRYVWGYRGVEPSEFLFDGPAVSKTLRAKYFDDKYWELYRNLVSSKNHNKQLEEMNIKYLVLHNDLVSEASGASSSAQVRNTLKQNNKIIFLRQIGGLEIYEFSGNPSGSTFISDAKNPPKVIYRKFGPSHYLVSIRDAKAPFNLIFKETYNDFWEAKVDKKKLENHGLAYNYANVWKMDRTGDYDIDIVFKVWPWK